MTRAEFEADLRKEGYEVREGEIKPNEHREAHAHGFDARVFVLDGSITLVFGKDRVTYGPGDSCSVPAGTVHEEHTDADGVPDLLVAATPETAFNPQQLLNKVCAVSGANAALLHEWPAATLGSGLGDALVQPGKRFHRRHGDGLDQPFPVGCQRHPRDEPRVGSRS